MRIILAIVCLAVAFTVLIPLAIRQFGNDLLQIELEAGKEAEIKGVQAAIEQAAKDREEAKRMKAESTNQTAK